MTSVADVNVPSRALLSGDEAIALAAFDAGVTLGTGYPGTPSTEILESLEVLHERAQAAGGAGGVRVQWAPNEKVAMEVGLGAAFAGGRALVTMKHVGVNVAADPLFTAAYTGVNGGLVLISADDPGMHSSQNEQDNRNYAAAAGVPMLEPTDPQEAYDFLRRAFEISEQFKVVVILRVTTRVCHSKGIVNRGTTMAAPAKPGFVRDIKGRVMIPGYAKPAHKRLREKLKEIAKWNGQSDLNLLEPGTGAEAGTKIITSGISYLHAREAAPGATILKLGMTYPLPLELVRKFVGSDPCLVIEEGDAYLTDAFNAAGIKVEGKPEMYRFGELNVERVRRILKGDVSAEAAVPPGKAPQLCVSCPYHGIFDTFRKLDCIVAGDIGCYTLGVLPPYQAMDTCVCMGASLGVGLGLRHSLPEAEARRVVSVIGDSTFVHTGINGLMEMIYNPPTTGHVLVILDNGTTAMTGQQEHPGTGRRLNHEGTGKVRIEEIAKALGIKNVFVVDAGSDPKGFSDLLQQRLATNELSVIVSRRPCLLAAAKIRVYEAAVAAKCGECKGECESH